MKNTNTYTKANFKNARILIIENNDDQWLLMKQSLFLCRSEVSAVRAAISQEAVSLLNTWRYQEWELPQLILLDLYLPTRVNGFQILRHIKGMDRPIRQIPITMFTSSLNSDDIQEAYRLGVSAYMAKPIGLNDGQSCFNSLLTYWLETAALPPIQYAF